MRPHTGAYIFLNWILIPALSYVLVMTFNYYVQNIGYAFLFALLVYFLAFVASSVVKEHIRGIAFKSVKDFARKMLLILLKAGLVAAGIIGGIFAFFTDGASINAEINGRWYMDWLVFSQYMLIFSLIYIMVIILTNFSIKGE